DRPRGVRRELEGLAPVELLDRVHQAEVPFLDEVEEGQARRLCRLRERADEPQVGLHERALGVVALARRAAELTLLGGGEVLAGGEKVAARGVAVLDLLRQANLVVLREQRILPDIGQIEPDEIFLVPLDSLLCHECLSRCGTVRSARENGVHEPGVPRSGGKQAGSVPCPQVRYRLRQGKFPTARGGHSPRAGGAGGDSWPISSSPW